MWKNYFGPKAKIFGVDINPKCKSLEEDQVKIFIGDQEDRGFLRSLAKEIPRIDILLDDGGHTMKQQINTFEELFPHIENNGVTRAKICSLHTAIILAVVLKNPASYIEYSKNFIDQIHARHSHDTTKLSVNDFTRSAHSLHITIVYW